MLRSKCQRVVSIIVDDCGILTTLHAMCHCLPTKSKPSTSPEIWYASDQLVVLLSVNHHPSHVDISYSTKHRRLAHRNSTFSSRFVLLPTRWSFNHSSFHGRRCEMTRDDRGITRSLARLSKLNLELEVTTITRLRVILVASSFEEVDRKLE